MSKPVKEMIMRDLGDRYGQQENAVWVELVGVDGITTNEFRRDLREREMKLEVVKTSLFRRACSDGPMAKLAERLEGPAALVTGGESAIEIAKMLDEWKSKFPKDSFHLRGALLEGELIDEQAVESLHKMLGRLDLQAKVVTLVISPGRKLMGAVAAPGGKIMGAVKQIIEKLEDGEEIKKTA